MKKNIIFSLATILLVAGGVQSCTSDFEEMNRDPQNPTQSSIPAVFNSIVSRLMLVGQEQAAIHNGKYYFQTQQLGNAAGSYNIANASNDVWSNYYYSLKNVRMLDQLLTESDKKVENAKAMLNIIFAYHTLRVINYFGDIPFSEAGKGNEGTDYFRVKYDNHKDIYYECLDMLKSAAEALTTDAQQYSYGNGDVLFKGDISLWKKFANSIRLRYAMQIVEVDANKASAIVGEILGNPGQYPVIGATSSNDSRPDESIGMWLKDLANLILSDSREWSFSANNYSCMGSLMWSLMSDSNNEAGEGIFDPRCYVFFEPNHESLWKAYPQNGGGLPQSGTAYNKEPAGRDYGQTVDSWNNKGVECYYSPVNFYLVRDVDYVPELFITAAEVKFLTAEAYNRGIGVAKNAVEAQKMYEEGIRTSIKFWYHLVTNDSGSTKWLFGPVSTHLTPDIDAYLAKVPYSTDESAALRQIYQQIWIDSFRQPWVAFDLYRRTLATPRDESAGYKPGDYNFYKLPYPEDERINNGEYFQAATGGNNATDKKLFWHK
ncbi:MAG: SusD/RagB family nutrient-binding outer membrane lipoprotein [Tannerellaceae bacterium]|jgi:hypothetical protein|nr:SusD/RagB family nutrient-binding outer membrane lipoprotein [Tannerellaceae bacterium]